MQFLPTFVSLIALAHAQQAYNQILSPGANSVIQAGGGVQTVTWANWTSGNISIALYSGTNPIVTVDPLASSIANTGTFMWNPETWLPSGNDYTIGIVDLTGSAPIQYSPYFTVQLCSTCSSSTRSTTSSFSAQTVSVSGLDIGTRSALAFPIAAQAAATASGSQVSSGVAARPSVTTSAAVSRATAPQSATGTAAASRAASGAASSDAAAASSAASGSSSAATTSVTASGAQALELGAFGFFALFAAFL